jgi:hypothetical protein
MGSNNGVQGLGRFVGKWTRDVRRSLLELTNSKIPTPVKDKHMHLPLAVVQCLLHSNPSYPGLSAECHQFSYSNAILLFQKQSQKQILANEVTTSEFIYMSDRGISIVDCRQTFG